MFCAEREDAGARACRGTIEVLSPQNHQMVYLCSVERPEPHDSGHLVATSFLHRHRSLDPKPQGDDRGWPPGGHSSQANRSSDRGRVVGVGEGRYSGVVPISAPATAFWARQSCHVYLTWRIPINSARLVEPHICYARQRLNENLRLSCLFDLAHTQCVDDVYTLSRSEKS